MQTELQNIRTKRYKGEYNWANVKHQTSTSLFHFSVQLVKALAQFFDGWVGGGWCVVCKPISVLSFDQAEQNVLTTAYFSEHEFNAITVDVIDKDILVKKINIL